MTLILELSPEQEQHLEAEAARWGMEAKDYALALLTRLPAEDKVMLPNGIEIPADVSLPPDGGTGADLVAYWKRVGVIGSRPDITDSQAYAREIRRKAERRSRG